MMPEHFLITGGAGFIGSNFVRWVLEHDPNVFVTNLDLLTYAGNLKSLEDVEQRFGHNGDGRYRFVRGDIRDFELVKSVLRADMRKGDRVEGLQYRAHIDLRARPPDAVVHFAAESHVDRSILGPTAFVDTNVRGTQTLLEACREVFESQPRAFRFLHISTDEVYGELGPADPPFTEESPLSPNNPYSASKASADHIVRSYVRTYGFPAIISRCSNNYGPFQFPEKLIPLMITRASKEESLPVYGSGKHIRDWIHVEDHCGALWAIMDRGVTGSTYNIGGETEITNVEIVTRLLSLLKKPDSLIEFVRDRPGHDRRYAVDISKIKNDVGWSPKRSISDGLKTTVEWYLNNCSWWEDVLSEAYRIANEMYLNETH